MSDLSIEKNIPIPARKGWGKFHDTIHSMEIGDSVLLTEQRDVANFMSVGKRVGLKMSSRKVDGGWRVWRIQ